MTQKVRRRRPGGENVYKRRVEDDARVVATQYRDEIHLKTSQALWFSEQAKKDMKNNATARDST